MQLDAQGTDYRSILREELALRCRQNPRYSLRAFARDLKLSPSRLSEILSGKQGLSRDVAEKVAKALGYASGEAERFCDLVESIHARSRKDRENARVRLKKHQLPSAEHMLQIDTFKVISDWYHFAILELAKLPSFESDSRWISRKLGVAEVEVQLALERLLRLGLLVHKAGKIKPSHESGAVLGDVPSETIKRFHSQILGKAKDALFLQSVEERDFQSHIMAIDRSRLDEAKEALREFGRTFCAGIQNSPSGAEAPEKDSVYCLAIQFFDLSDRIHGEV